MSVTMRSRLLVGAAVVGLVLAACSSGGGGGSGQKQTINLAVNPWVGYEANAGVIANLLKTQLGYTVEYKDLAEQVSWEGFESGTVDAILENWGHPDLAKTYIDDKKVAVDAGSTGVDGIIGWYVPPWMAEEYPDITDWNNLNKYADLFKTSESGGKGQLLDGDPSYVTNDEALVKNLKLNYKVVVGGSEAALIQSFRSAEKNKTPLLAYFYEPQWFFSEMKLVRVHLPKYTPGCDADAAKVACDYPPYHLNKLISTKFADSGSPAVTLVKQFHWTNDDQNEVAEYIAKDGMKPEDAAKKWIDANPDLVNQWLQGT